MEENINEEKKENIEIKNDIKEINQPEEKVDESPSKTNDIVKDPLENEVEEVEGINKEDINNIVNYLTNLDFDKYCRDMEIKEALMVLKTKFDKEQELKEKEDDNLKVKIIEDNNITNNNKIVKNEEEEEEEKEKIINQQTLYKDKIIKEIEEKKEDNDIKAKEPKEIIDEAEIKKKEKIENYKIAEQIAKTEALKDVHSVKSVQKLLMRENIDNSVPLRITVIKESPLASSDEYVPNKLPFLRSLPLV